MKPFRIILAGLLVAGLSLFGYVNLVASPGSAGADLVAEANEQIKTFSIEKMTCAACPITVSKAMKKVAGVKSVDVDFEAKTARVRFDPTVTDTNAIARASANAGYPAALSDES